jgi:hypothetical protein
VLPEDPLELLLGALKLLPELDLLGALKLEEFELDLLGALPEL